MQAPVQTAGHRIIRVAAQLGVCFVLSHLITVVVTCIADGFHWGINAWVLDTLGFGAGLFFTVQCWKASNCVSGTANKRNVWICVWACVTLCSRSIDTLMLFGVIKWDDVYATPTGPTLWANVVSEVTFGNAFALAALLGSCMLLFKSQPAAG
ncbi:MAG TPA: hypothetical protein DDW52_15415 [Planctomycetaceae bacterium]|nr:hypothetical protein [Planctomycetaceae bacterium]